MADRVTPSLGEFIGIALSVDPRPISWCHDHPPITAELIDSVIDSVMRRLIDEPHERARTAVKRALRLHLWQLVQATLLRPWISACLNAFPSCVRRRRPQFVILEADCNEELEGRIYIDEPGHLDRVRVVIFASGDLSRDVNTILHELAHVIGATEPSEDDHGMTWARAYCEAARKLLRDATGLEHPVDLDPYAGQRVTGRRIVDATGSVTVTSELVSAHGHYQSDQVERALRVHLDGRCLICA